MNEDLDEDIHAPNFLDLVCYADGGLRKVMYLVDNTCDEDHSFTPLLTHLAISDRSELPY